MTAPAFRLHRGATHPYPPQRRDRGAAASSRYPCGELPWRANIAAVLGALIALAVIFRTQVDLRELQAQASRLPAAACLRAAARPAAGGLPASLLHIAAGIRFGAPLAFRARGGVRFSFHLVASSFIVRRWHERFRAPPLARTTPPPVPHGAHAGVTVFTVLLPGAP